MQYPPYRSSDPSTKQPLRSSKTVPLSKGDCSWNLRLGTQETHGSALLLRLLIQVVKYRVIFTNKSIISCHERIISPDRKLDFIK